MAYGKIYDKDYSRSKESYLADWHRMHHRFYGTTFLAIKKRFKWYCCDRSGKSESYLIFTFALHPTK